MEGNRKKKSKNKKGKRPGDFNESCLLLACFLPHPCNWRRLSNSSLRYPLPCVSVTDCRGRMGPGSLSPGPLPYSSSPCSILLLAFLQLQLFCSSICCSCLISTTATLIVHPFLLSFHSPSFPTIPTPLPHPLIPRSYPTPCLYLPRKPLLETNNSHSV